MSYDYTYDKLEEISESIGILSRRLSRDLGNIQDRLSSIDRGLSRLESSSSSISSSLKSIKSSLSSLESELSRGIDRLESTIGSYSSSISSSIEELRKDLRSSTDALSKSLSSIERRIEDAKSTIISEEKTTRRELSKAKTELGSKIEDNKRLSLSLVSITAALGTDEMIRALFSSLKEEEALKIVSSIRHVKLLSEVKPNLLLSVEPKLLKEAALKRPEIIDEEVLYYLYKTLPTDEFLEILEISSEDSLPKVLSNLKERKDTLEAIINSSSKHVEKFISRLSLEEAISLINGERGLRNVYKVFGYEISQKLSRERLRRAFKILKEDLSKDALTVHRLASLGLSEAFEAIEINPSIIDELISPRLNERDEDILYPLIIDGRLRRALSVLKPEKIAGINDLSVLCEAYEIHGRALLEALDDMRLNALAKSCGLKLEDFQDFLDRLEPGAVVRAIKDYGEKAERVIIGKINALSLEALSAIAPMISSESLSEIINTIGLEKSLEAFYKIRVDYRALAILVYLFGDIGERLSDEVLIELATRYKRLIAKNFDVSILRLPEDLQIEVLRLKDDDALDKRIREHREEASIRVLREIKRDSVFEAYLEMDVKRFLSVSDRPRVVRGYERYGSELYKLLSKEDRLRLLEEVPSIDASTAKIALIEDFDEAFERLKEKFPEALRDAVDEEVINALDDEQLYRLSLFYPNVLASIEAERAARIALEHPDIVEELVKRNPKFVLYLPQEFLDSIVEKTYESIEALSYALLRSSMKAYEKILEDSPKTLKAALEKILEKLSDEKIAKLLYTDLREIVLSLEPKRLASIVPLVDREIAIRLFKRVPETLKHIDVRPFLGERIVELEDEYAKLFLYGIEAARIFLKHGKLVEEVLKREDICLEIEPEYLEPYIDRSLLRRASPKLFRRLIEIKPSVENRRDVKRLLKEYGKEKVLLALDYISSALGINESEARIVVEAVSRGYIEREDLINKKVGEILLRFVGYDESDYSIVLRLAYLGLKRLEAFSDEVSINILELPHREKNIPFEVEEKRPLEEYEPSLDDLIISLLAGLCVRKKGFLKKKEVVGYCYRS